MSVNASLIQYKPKPPVQANNQWGQEGINIDFDDGASSKAVSHYSKKKKVKKMKKKKGMTLIQDEQQQELANERAVVSPQSKRGESKPFDTIESGQSDEQLRKPPTSGGNSRKKPPLAGQQNVKVDPYMFNKPPPEHERKDSNGFNFSEDEDLK